MTGRELIHLIKSTSRMVAIMSYDLDSNYKFNTLMFSTELVFLEFFKNVMYKHYDGNFYKILEVFIGQTGFPFIRISPGSMQLHKNMVDNFYVIPEQKWSS